MKDENNPSLECTTEQVDDKTTRHRIISHGQYLTYASWIFKILEDDKFVLDFNQLFSDSKFDAFFWEVKPVSEDSIDQDFEFVLIESRALSRIKANPSNFEKHLDNITSVACFSNLGGDAELVAPTSISKQTNYAHLATFAKTAMSSQIIDFWRAVVMAYSQNIGKASKWLSTSGLGVHWLHVRIDTIPKYYQHSSYRI